MCSKNKIFYCWLNNFFLHTNGKFLFILHKLILKYLIYLLTKYTNKFFNNNNHDNNKIISKHLTFMNCINIKQYEFVLNILDNVFIPIV